MSSHQPLAARVVIDPAAQVAPVKRRLFGSFVEHLGRCVYTGIYEPGHPTADEDGFRGDVLALTQELGVSVVRYPGGNFVSNYRWEDGVGPRDRRPVRRDLAWRSIETNEIGVDEFIKWAGRAGVEPMLAVNLGTRGVAEALDLLEYANHPAGTTLSDQRVANGASRSSRGSVVVPRQRARRAVADRTQDRSGVRAARRRDGAGDAPGGTRPRARGVRQLRTRRCRRSGRGRRRCSRRPTTSSTTSRSTPTTKNTTAIPAASSPRRSTWIASSTRSPPPPTTSRQARREQAHRPLVRRVERVVPQPGSRTTARNRAGHSAPRLIEDRYSVTDAVVVGNLLISLLRHADRVAVACLAQLVNVIAPIMTEPGGPAWRQTTFHPFAADLALRQRRRVAPRDRLAELRDGAIRRGAARRRRRHPATTPAPCCSSSTARSMPRCSLAVDTRPLGAQTRRSTASSSPTPTATPATPRPTPTGWCRARCRRHHLTPTARSCSAAAGLVDDGAPPTS